MTNKVILLGKLTEDPKVIKIHGRINRVIVNLETIPDKEKFTVIIENDVWARIAAEFLEEDNNVYIEGRIRYKDQGVLGEPKMDIVVSKKGGDYLSMLS